MLAQILILLSRSFLVNGLPKKKKLCRDCWVFRQAPGLEPLICAYSNIINNINNNTTFILTRSCILRGHSLNSIEIQPPNIRPASELFLFWNDHNPHQMLVKSEIIGFNDGQGKARKRLYDGREGKMMAWPDQPCITSCTSALFLNLLTYLHRDVQWWCSCSSVTSYALYAAVATFAGAPRSMGRVRVEPPTSHWSDTSYIMQSNRYWCRI